MIRLTFLFAVCLLSACLNSSRFDTCADGEQLAEVGGREGCFPECGDGCADSDSCIQGVCVSSELLGRMPDLGTDVGSDMDKPNVDPAEFCEKLSDLIFGCANTHCTLSEATQAAVERFRGRFMRGTPENIGCLESAATNEGYVRSGQALLEQETCDTTRVFRCDVLDLASQCECSPPETVGATCREEADCESGDFSASCLITELNPEGTCIAGCPDSLPEQSESYLVRDEARCGEGNYCTVIVAENDPERFGYCLRGCSRQSDCEGDSVCAVVGVDDAGQFERVCFPWSDCESCRDRCNSDGVCEVTCAEGLETVCGNSGGRCEMDGENSFCVLP